MAKALNLKTDKPIDKRTLGNVRGKNWTVADTSRYKGKPKGAGLKPNTKKKVTKTISVDAAVWEIANKKYPRKISSKIEDFLKLLIKD